MSNVNNSTNIELPHVDTSPLEYVPKIDSDQSDIDECTVIGCIDCTKVKSWADYDDDEVDNTRWLRTWEEIVANWGSSIDATVGQPFNRDFTAPSTDPSTLPKYSNVRKSYGVACFDKFGDLLAVRRACTYAYSDLVFSTEMPEGDKAAEEEIGHIIKYLSSGEALVLLDAVSEFELIREGNFRGELKLTCDYGLVDQLALTKIGRVRDSGDRYVRMKVYAPKVEAALMLTYSRLLVTSRNINRVKSVVRRIANSPTLLDKLRSVADSKVVSLTWNIPRGGAKRNSKESGYDTAKREFFEETTIDKRNVKFYPERTTSYSYVSGPTLYEHHYLYATYSGDRADVKPKWDDKLDLLPENDWARWVSYSEFKPWSASNVDPEVVMANRTEEFRAVFVGPRNDTL